MTNTDKANGVAPAEFVAEFRERYALHRDQDGAAYATAKSGPHRPFAVPVSRAVEDTRSALFLLAGRVTNSATMEFARSVIATMANGAPARTRSMRVAIAGEARYIDLGTGRIVHLDAHGVGLIEPEDYPDDAPAFHRPNKFGTLPDPVDTATGPASLARVLALDSESDSARLLWGWLVSTVVYGTATPPPGLWFIGPPGSAKSTRARMVVSVIDPLDALGRAPGKNAKDDETVALGRYVPTYDNLGRTLSAAVSDALCCVITGFTVDRRELYTTAGIYSATVRRTIVLTSLVMPAGVGADLVERTIPIHLTRPAESDRVDEATVWDAFTAAHPRILGALLHDVAEVLRVLPSVRADARRERRSLPRMADHALALTALDTLDGRDGYAETYVRAVRGEMAERANDEPLVQALCDIVWTVADQASAGTTWRGTMTDLLARLAVYRPAGREGEYWPSTAKKLRDGVTSLGDALRAAGIVVAFERTHGRRLVTVTVPPRDESDDACPPPDRARVPFTAREPLSDGNAFKGIPS